MDVYLVDGTYELFRYFFAVPPQADANGQEVGAVRGVVASILSMIENGATHIGVATDHVVESFRNDLYPGYKTSEGVPEELLSQFPILEDALQALGVVVWPMVYYEADDALASAAAKFALDQSVTRVLICTPDKDLSQCIVGTRVIQLDRRHNVIRDEAGVVARFGVRPQSIPDYLALVGDSADGFPGISLWGLKRRLWRYLNICILKVFLRIGRSGIPQFAGRDHYPNLCSAHGTTPYYSAHWQPSGWMFQCLRQSKT